MGPPFYIRAASWFFESHRGPLRLSRSSPASASRPAGSKIAAGAIHLALIQHGMMIFFTAWALHKRRGMIRPHEEGFRHRHAQNQ
jgi:hypothetical protein